MRFPDILNKLYSQPMQSSLRNQHGNRWRPTRVGNIKQMLEAFSTSREVVRRRKEYEIERPEPSQIWKGE